jgi:hypothetical protein
MEIVEVQDIELIVREGCAGAERQCRGGQKTHSEGLLHLSLLFVLTIRPAYAPRRSPTSMFSSWRSERKRKLWASLGFYKATK